jgi:hypothetical protein
MKGLWKRIERPEKTTRGANQNSWRELSLYLKIDPTPLSSNSARPHSYSKAIGLRSRVRDRNRKHEPMLARQRARSTTKIRSRNNLYYHRHFTEHLVDVFRKQPVESD